MSLLAVAGTNSAVAGGYDIENSLKLEADNSERLYFTPSSSGNRKTWTFSCWFKITEADKYCMLMGSADTYMYIDQYGGDMHIRLNGSNYLYTTPVYRDTSAWYHFVLAVDTTQATAANRAKFYVNGVQVTDFATEVYPSQNLDTSWNFTNAHYVGGWTSTLYDSSGYIAEVHSVDGQQLAPTDFGEFDSDTGIWKPIEYTGSYGTNGFYLEFKNSADLGDDTSGNNKNFVLQNITSADQATDTPTNNFCTLNPLLAIDTAWTYTDGATSGYDGGGDSFAEGTIGFTSGKWYYEIVQPAESGNPSANMMMGYGRPNLWGTTSNVGGDTYSFAYNRTGVVFYNGTTTSGWSAYSKDDVVMVAIDADNGFAYFGVNGSWGNGGVPTSGSSGTGAFDYDSLVTNISVGDLLIPAMAAGNAGNIIEVNFGGFTEFPIASGNTDENGYGNFEYAPPSGYYALCSKNLAEYG